MANDLTLKQAKFVDAYIETNGNGAKSAAIAGYSPQSENYLRVAAHRAITNDNVSKAIESKVKAIFSPDEILESYSKIARKKHDDKDIKVEHTLKALEFGAKYYGLIDDRPQINLSLNHWQSTIQAQAIRSGRSIHDETRIAISLPDSVIPADVKAELAKTLNTAQIEDDIDF